MRVLVVKDDGQLRRIERAIAEIEARPPMEQRRKACLLRGPPRERETLLRESRYLRPAARVPAGARA